MKRGFIETIVLTIVLLVLGCTEENRAPPLESLKPEPLPRVTRPELIDASVDPREAMHQIRPFEIFGRSAKKAAATLRLTGASDNLVLESRAKVAVESAAKRPGEALLITFDDEVYLAQIVALLAELDDRDVRVFFKHPAGPAFEVTLRDEVAFNEWVQEPKPGRLRIIQRADGLELTTNIGKLPGPDANGPSIPIRGGQLDIATLREALEKLKRRFGDKGAEVCLLPSFGTELRKIADVMSGTFRAPDEPIYEALCLVYPRPLPKK